MKFAMAFGLWLLAVLVIVFVGSVIPFTHVTDDDPMIVSGPFARVLPPFDPADLHGPFCSLLKILSYWLGLGTKLVSLIWIPICASFVAAGFLTSSHRLPGTRAGSVRSFVLTLYWITPALAGILSLMYLYALVFREIVPA